MSIPKKPICKRKPILFTQECIVVDTSLRNPLVCQPPKYCEPISIDIHKYDSKTKAWIKDFSLTFPNEEKND